MDNASDNELRTDGRILNAKSALGSLFSSQRDLLRHKGSKAHNELAERQTDPKSISPILMKPTSYYRYTERSKNQKCNLIKAAKDDSN